MIEDIELDNEELKRGENETEEEYQFRVCDLKEKFGLRWDDICFLLNKELGYNYTESRYRKMYSAYLAGYKMKEREVEEDIESSKPFLSCEEDALKEAYGLSAGKLSYYRLLRHEGRFERFYKLVAESIKRLVPPTPFVRKETGTVENKSEYVLTIADTHIGACFVSANNHYSVKEAEARFEKLFFKMVDFVEKKQIKKLKILSLGDLVQGILRLNDLRLNEMAVVDAFVVACRMYANFLNALSAHCEIEFLQVCYSNHDQMRPLGSKASEFGTEDMGKIFFAYLQDTLKDNKRISIIGDTDKDYLEFNIGRFKCFALHGHQVKEAKSLYKDLATRHRRFYDYIFVGHTHSTKEFVNAEGDTYDAETLVSGSFCGSDPYADKLMVGSKASCKIYEFNQEEGHSASYKIILN